MLGHIYEYVRTVGRPEARGNAARLPHGSSPWFARRAMDAEFVYPFEPHSPEKLIYQFCRTHCCSTSYQSCAPGSKFDMIKHDSFTLPFDTFLRSVSGFNPVRDHFLNDGPHVYARQFMEAYFPDDRRKALALDIIAETMMSYTSDAMGTIANFLEYASKEFVSHA